MLPWLFLSLQQRLQEFSLPIARKLSLTRLPEFFPLVVAFFIFFQALEWVSPMLLGALSPIHFGQANRRTKRNWAIRVVSTAHALIVVPMAIACLNYPELDKDRAFGFNDPVGRLTAVACGYFIWDLIDSVIHFTTIGFVIHGAVCLMVYSQAFRPFLGYYGTRFLLWELSTPFLNMHWFFDKSNMTGSVLQVVNGIVLVITFFIVRLCYGGLMSYRFFITLWDVRFQLPLLLAVAYAVGNLSLQALNWFWFYKMLQALQKRFSGKKTPSSDEYVSSNDRKME